MVGAFSETDNVMVSASNQSENEVEDDVSSVGSDLIIDERLDELDSQSQSILAN